MGIKTYIVRRVPRLFMMFAIGCMVIVALADIFTGFSHQEEYQGREKTPHKPKAMRHLALKSDYDVEVHQDIIRELVNGANTRDANEALDSPQYKEHYDYVFRNWEKKDGKPYKDTRRGDPTNAIYRPPKDQKPSGHQRQGNGNNAVIAVGNQGDDYYDYDARLRGPFGFGRGRRPGMGLGQRRRQPPSREQMMRQQKLRQEQEALMHPTIPTYKGTLYLPTDIVNRKRADDDKYKINITNSDLVPLDRVVPEARIPQCHNISYDTRGWPKVSVIVPFHNEGLSMLLRTVVSLINQSPPDLLQEIILVDDFSDYEDNKEMLETLLYGYKGSEKVKIIRNKRREGLMRTRQIGADAALGEILIFEDSHSESHFGWLEPIVAELVKNPNTIVQPAIGNIDARVHSLNNPIMSEAPRSGFTLNMRLIWMPLPPGYKPDSPEPFPVPTLAGCVFAVRADFFQKIGGFDKSYELWGGENMEVPLRAWMCHGRVVTLPCSIVYHTFRPHTYAAEQKDNEIFKNLARVAEMWMGPYAYWFYETHQGKRFLNDTDMAVLQQRREELEPLQCHDFDWFLDNILTDLLMPPKDAVYSGQLLHFGRGGGALYIESKNGHHSVSLEHKTNPHRLDPNLFFAIDTRGRLIWELHNLCILPDINTGDLHVGDCESFEKMPGKWIFFHNDGYMEFYVKGVLFYEVTEPRKIQFCLTYDESNDSVYITQCSRENRNYQKWAITYRYMSAVNGLGKHK